MNVSAAPAVTDVKFLIVDDDAMIVDALARYLKGSGYEVESFTDSRKAFAYLQESRLQFKYGGGIDEQARLCVVSDVNMPGVSGLELAREFAGDFPFVLMSGREPDVAGLKIRALLQKPFDIDDLLAVFVEKQEAARVG